MKKPLAQQVLEAHKKNESENPLNTESGDFKDKKVVEAELDQETKDKIKANNDKMDDLKKNGGSQEEIDKLEDENDKLNGGNNTAKDVDESVNEDIFDDLMNLSNDEFAAKYPPDKKPAKADIKIFFAISSELWGFKNLELNKEVLSALESTQKSNKVEGLYSIVSGRSDRKFPLKWFKTSCDKFGAVYSYSAKQAQISVDDIIKQSNDGIVDEGIKIESLARQVIEAYSNDKRTILEYSEKDWNYIVAVAGVDKNFFKKELGQRVDDVKKLKDFMEKAKTRQVAAGGDLTLAKVKKEIKDAGLSGKQHYAKWSKDATAVTVYYKD